MVVFVLKLVFFNNFLNRTFRSCNKVTENEIVPADCVLISQKAIVDESMLTGESMPVTKVPIDPSESVYDKVKDKDSTLYGAGSAN